MPAQDPTTGRSSAPSTDGTQATADRAALSALVHRLNGCLNNASLAFEVALGNTEGVRRDAVLEEALRTGLASIARASRAAMLLAYLVGGQRFASEPSELYMEDVRELLAEHARATGRADLSELPAGAHGPADAAQRLLFELSRMEGKG